MRIRIASVFTLAIIGQVAHADDIDTDPAFALVGATSWNGAYVGAAIGYGWLSDIDYAFAPPLRSSGRDVIFGGHVGYLHQFDGYVVGAEADIMRLDINFEGFPIDAENSYAIKARVGATLDRFLLTGHAGAVYATTNIGLKDWGWVIGAGVDYLVTDNLVAGVSFDHMRFSRFDGTLIDARLNLVKTRLSIKF